MKNKPKLSLGMLYVQYDSWLQNYGKGRDENDLRFGQWIHNNFDIKPSHDRIITLKDGYYTEDPELAFEELSTIIDK
jgi:hypothetical protein